MNRNTTQRTAMLVALAAGASIASATTTTVTFDSGAEGWSGPSGIGGATTIEAAGGNPGANMRTIFNDFGITFRNDTNTAFVQDLSQYDSFTISIDTKVDFLNFFGQDVSRPWLVELRDYDNVSTGYPWVSVWFKFADISQASTGSWTTFSVTVTDPQSAALPAGWGGFGDEDPMTFEPILPADRTFADVLAGVDEIVFTTLQPGFFFGFTDHTVRIDNISITTNTGGGSQTIFDTGNPGGPFGFIGYDVSANQSVAVGFTPDEDYTLDQIALWIMSNDFENPGRTYEVSLRLDASGGTTVPGDIILESWSVATEAVGWAPVLEPVESVLNPTLSAGVTYWIVAESDEPAGLSPVWVWGNSSEEVPFANIDFQSGPEWQGGTVIGSAPGALVMATPAPACPGDITGPGGAPDGQVDVDDLNAILSAWDTSVGVGSPIDVANNDGHIDVDDLNVVLSNWQCN